MAILKSFLPAQAVIGFPARSADTVIGSWCGDGHVTYGKVPTCHTWTIHNSSGLNCEDRRLYRPLGRMVVTVQLQLTLGKRFFQKKRSHCLLRGGRCSEDLTIFALVVFSCMIIAIDFCHPRKCFLSLEMYSGAMSQPRFSYVGLSPVLSFEISQWKHNPAGLRVHCCVPDEPPVSKGSSTRAYVISTAFSLTCWRCLPHTALTLSLSGEFMLIFVFIVIMLTCSAVSSYLDPCRLSSDVHHYQCPCPFGGNASVSRS